MDSVPPAASPPSSFVVAAGASGTSVGYVFVKRNGDAHARFAEVAILEDDTVTRLAERASLKLDWRTSAAYLELFLVKSAGSERASTTPTQAQIDAVLADGHNVLGEGMPLSLAGIVSGAWIVARLTDPSAAVPGKCAREPVRLHSCSSNWRPGGLTGCAWVPSHAPITPPPVPCRCARCCCCWRWRGPGGVALTG